MIRSLWAALNLTIATFSIAAIVIVATPLGAGGRFYRRAATFWARWALWSSAVRVRLVDLHHLEIDEPQIVVANHVSWYDVFALAAFLPKRYRFIAKIELSRVPLFGRAWLAAGHIAVDRSDRQAAVASLDAAAVAIREDHSAIVIFPEGTRSGDGALLPFKKGAFMVALRTGVDIVPVAITGSRAVLPKGGWRVRPGEITIRFGPPISAAGYTEANRDELIHRVRGEIAGMSALATPPAE